MPDSRDPHSLLDRAERAFVQTRFGDAAIHARAAMEAYRDHGDKLGEARALGWYGAAQTQQSQYRTALEALDDAVARLNELGHSELTGHPRNYIAIVHEELGDIDAAMAQYEKALAAAREKEDRLLEGRILANIGDAYVSLGQHDEALPSLQAAAGVLELDGDPSLLGWTLCAIARIHMARDELEEAETWMKRSLKAAASGEGLRSEGEIFMTMGDLLTRKGEFDAAVDYLQRALAIARKLDVRREIYRAHEALSRCYQAQGQFELALAEYQRFHAVHAEVVDDVAKAKVGTLSVEMARERSRLEGEVSHLREVELADAREKVERLSMLDPLTDCFNRRYLDRSLAREYRRARRHGSPLSLAMMDVDDFKAINDQFTHAVGDYVLAMLTEIVTSQIRTEDILARFGGEEFALLLPDTNLGGAVRACEKIRKSIESYEWENAGEGLAVTVSFGLASAEGTDDQLHLLHNAERELHRAKAEGKNRVEPRSALESNAKPAAPQPSDSDPG